MKIRSTFIGPLIVVLFIVGMTTEVTASPSGSVVNVEFTRITADGILFRAPSSWTANFAPIGLCFDSSDSSLIVNPGNAPLQCPSYGNGFKTEINMVVKKMRGDAARANCALAKFFQGGRVEPHELTIQGHRASECIGKSRGLITSVFVPLETWKVTPGLGIGKWNSSEVVFEFVYFSRFRSLSQSEVTKDQAIVSRIISSIQDP